MLAPVKEKRARIVMQLAQVDAEIARLETVISFAPTPGTNGAKLPSKKLPKGTWQARIDAILATNAYTLADLMVALKAKHEVTFSSKALAEILARGERHKRWRKDDERRWHNAPRKNAQWHQGVPGATA